MRIFNNNPITFFVYYVDLYCIQKPATAITEFLLSSVERAKDKVIERVKGQGYSISSISVPFLIQKGIAYCCTTLGRPNVRNVIQLKESELWGFRQYLNISMMLSARRVHEAANKSVAFDRTVDAVAWKVEELAKRHFNETKDSETLCKSLKNQTKEILEKSKSNLDFSVMGTIAHEATYIGVSSLIRFLIPYYTSAFVSQNVAWQYLYMGGVFWLTTSALAHSKLKELSRYSPPTPKEVTDRVLRDNMDDIKEKASTIFQNNSNISKFHEALESIEIDVERLTPFSKVENEDSDFENNLDSIVKDNRAKGKTVEEWNKRVSDYEDRIKEMAPITNSKLGEYYDVMTKKEIAQLYAWRAQNSTTFRIKAKEKINYWKSQLDKMPTQKQYIQKLLNTFQTEMDK